jgi:hypothetical protein
MRAKYKRRAEEPAPARVAIPVVGNTATGQLKLENFGGRWGNPKHRDRFLRAAAAEKVKMESRKKGHVGMECHDECAGIRRP